MNNEERRQWILNDEGLYNWQRSSGLNMAKFIRENREQIDAAIGNVTSGAQPAHYLAYRHDGTCACASCQRERRNSLIDSALARRLHY
jgi:hypothetical protein